MKARRSPTATRMKARLQRTRSRASSARARPRSANFISLRRRSRAGRTRRDARSSARAAARKRACRSEREVLMNRKGQGDGERRVRGRLERAELFFGCLVFFAGLFYLTREAKTDAQWYFRVVSFL